MRTIVGVPHPATSRDELVRAINARLDGPDAPLLVAGFVAMEPDDPDSAVIIEVEDAHPEMREAFAIAGDGRFAPADLDRIAEHGSCAYLIADPGGSIEAATRVLRAARAVLLAGGLGVKVESGSAATTAERWLDLGRDPTPGDLFGVYVGLVAEAGGAAVRSVGMHNLGLPDARTPAGDDGEAAAGLVNVFCAFLAIDAPVVRDGETFGVGPGAPVHRVALGPDDLDEDDLAHNPFGVWTLTRA